MTENNYHPNYVIRTGDYILENIECLGMSIDAVAEKTGIDAFDLRKMISGDMEISDSDAAKISSVVYIPKHILVNIEKGYREGLAKGLRVI